MPSQTTGHRSVMRQSQNVLPSKPHHQSRAASRGDVKQQQRSHTHNKTSARKRDTDRRRWCNAAEVEETPRLNWQQETLLKSKRLTEGINRPMLSTSPSIAPSTSKGSKRRSKTALAKLAPLPPLRFSSDHGKAAWRFVLSSPRPTRPKDLPNWCDGKTKDLVVTLASKHSTPPSSDTSSPPPIFDLDQHLDSFDSDTTSSSDLLDSSIGDRDGEEPGCSSINGLVSNMLGSLSIYAGPSFSAAAPEPCNLPFPSFLSRA